MTLAYEFIVEGVQKNGQPVSHFIIILCRCLSFFAEAGNYKWARDEEEEALK